MILFTRQHQPGTTSHASTYMRVLGLDGCGRLKCEHFAKGSLPDRRHPLIPEQSHRWPSASHSQRTIVVFSSVVVQEHLKSLFPFS